MAELITQHDYDDTTGGCKNCFTTVPIKEMDEYDNCFKCQDKYFALMQYWWHMGVCYQFGEIRQHTQGNDLDNQNTAKLERVFKDRLEYVSVYLTNDKEKNLLVWADDLL